MQIDSYSLVVSAVRLVGGKAIYYGRVEIYYIGYWTPVCGQFWDFNAATVVCRQLGYSRAVSAKLYGSLQGETRMSAVNCRGDETDLQLCPFDGEEESYCPAAGVVCGKMMYVNVANANVCENIVTASLLPVDWCLTL